MAIDSSRWPDLLEPGLREIATERALGRPSPFLQVLFGRRPSTKLQEHYLSAGSLGEVPRFEGSVAYRDPDEGFKVSITNLEFAMGIQIKRQWIDDEQYGMINQKAAELGDSFALTREKHAADVFAKAFVTTGYSNGESSAGGDGVALCSASHPLHAGDSSNTQSNTGTLPLTLENWDTTRKNMAAFTDSRSELMDISPDICLVPRALERTARQIFDPRAQFEPGSAEFTVNIFGGAVTVMVWDRLTDANNWFAIDSSLMRRSLVWQDRIPFEFAQAEDFDGLLQKYRGYERYGRGFNAWQFIYGHNVT